MSKQIVIYAAHDVQQAYLLKNELRRYGIRAWVTNEALTRGFGVECPSWEMLPRVIVREKDAAAARRIALSHDKQGAQTVENQLPDPTHFEENPQAWPRCPQCGAPRPAVCPICKTAGTHFPESDPDYAWGFGLEEIEDAQAAQSGTSCSCGAQGCGGSAAADQTQEETKPEVPAGEGDMETPPGEGDDDHPRPFVLRCTMCDEPFLPEFPNQCTWCGEPFEDGYELDPLHELPVQESAARIVLTVIGLILIGLLVLWLFVR